MPNIIEMETSQVNPRYRNVGCTPVGTIISYFGETAPEGFLICDGTAYNKDDYPELWDLLSSLTDTTPYIVDGDNTKFKVPDLRGEFLRGTGTNGHIAAITRIAEGSGANVGVHQDATNLGVNYYANSDSITNLYMNKDYYSNYFPLNPDTEVSSTYTTVGRNNANSRSGTISTSRAGTNTPTMPTVRPTNTSVLYCIAYKNVYLEAIIGNSTTEIINPRNGEVLVYNSTKKRWVNGAGGGAGGGVDYSSELNSLSEENSTQTSELGSLTSEVSSLSTETSEFTSELSSLSAENSLQTSELNSLSTENSLQTSEIGSLVSEIGSMSTGGSDYSSEIESLSTENSLQTSEINSLASEIDSMSQGGGGGGGADYSSEIQSLSTENSLQTSEINSLASEIDSISQGGGGGGGGADYSSEINSLTAVNNSQTSSINSLSQSASEIASTASSLSASVSTHDSQLSSLSTETSTHTSEINSLASEIDSMSQGGGGGGGGTDYSREINSLTSENSTQTSELNSLSTENSTQNSQLSSLETVNSTQTSEIDSLSTAQSELASETTEIGSEVTEITDGASAEVNYTGFNHGGVTPVYPSTGIIHNVGEVVGFYAETAPEGFLVCDGTQYLKADYSELWTALSSLTDTTPYVVDGDNTKFKVPDLRGEFLRGTGTNSHTNQGNGANVGVHQDATTVPRLEIFANSNSIYVGNVRYKSPYGDGSDTYIDNLDSVVGSKYTTTGQLTGGTIRESTPLEAFGTSRPTNTSVLYCIAYQNIYFSVQTLDVPVDISNPTDGQLLKYNATSQKWENATVETKHEYSMTEKVVGKWIDGRPIYEKIIEFSNGSGFPTITNIIENANELIGSYDILFKRQAGNSYQSIGFFYSVNDYCFPYIAIDTSTHYIQFITCESGGTYSKTTYYRAVVRYTKTTDTPIVQS